jgi:hypothetical protein
MANNVQLPGTGQTIATKDTGGVEYQEIILVDENGNRPINTASEESIILLRRIVKLLESSGIVDTAQRQRVSVDAIVALPNNQSVNISQIATTTTAVNIGLSSAGAQRMTLSNDSQIDNVVAIMREAYNSGIRNRLTFS